jgi:hypothetical protein
LAREVWVNAGAELVAVSAYIEAPRHAQEEDFAQHGVARIVICPAGQ